MRQQIVLEREDLKRLHAGEPLAMTFADGRVVTIVLEPGTVKAGRDNGKAVKTVKTRRKNSATAAELEEYTMNKSLRCRELGCEAVLRGTTFTTARGSLRRHARTMHKTKAAPAPLSGPSGVSEAHES